MKCPYCGQIQDRVVDSRESKGGEVIRRRRECEHCHRRFTSYEKIETIPYFVIKRNGNRDPFDREKVMTGLLKACEKRPVPITKLEAVADEVERIISGREEREISTEEIGKILMESLRNLDQVAYVRFASVYRRFEDIDSFIEEIRNLIPHKP
ncbi:MAG TPA: transcriptional regulator NrdR [Thermoanaerobaculia bacterium]|nr:transcriptional regulator NrdR [Thermoanaerobaculia bacterium]HUM28682.1 transcriptional regulator NrdR [Thermoanaerobaculia bacterium]HXK66710.1 transcriptional regulator NrdR [Thermoanaerobaculia bacterium]